MSHARSFSIIAFFSFVVLFTASCQTPESKKGAPSSDSTVQVQTSHKILFRDSIPKPYDYVNDYDKVYTGAQIAILDSLIGSFEKETTMQIAVITFSAVMLENDNLDSMTKKVANIWGVGQKDKNNGVTIGICRECRKISIRTSSGTEKILSNAETKEILDNSFIPGFKEANYFQGTLNGLNALTNTLRKKLRS